MLNTHARSTNRYYGVGLGLEYEFGQGFFADTSLRAGLTETDFSGDYERTSLSTSYDSRALYAGLALGGGYRFRLTEAFTLSPYARYFFTYTGSDKVSLSGIRERYQLEAIRAHTLKLGLDSLYTLSDTLALKTGLSLEKTFNGQARSRIGETNLATLSLQGRSAALELALRIRPQSIQGLLFELGATGKLGDCHGLLGQLKVLYQF